ncbi:MAG: IS5 family transposase [Candidatus Woesearchaeota archaeon]
MEKEEKLVNKIKRILKRIGCPRWLHHFGPKKYLFADHILALVVKQECKLGYRRLSRLLRALGIRCPCYSALWHCMNRIRFTLWPRILNATRDFKSYIVALDGTGMSRPLPSPYYYRRIDKPYPVDIPLKLSIAVDTRTKKIVALRLRATIAHDIKDAEYLVRRLPKTDWIVADKGYDADSLHRFCHARKIKCCIPMRDYGRSRHKRNSLRRQNQIYTHHKRYHRRENVEAVFKAMKCKFGPSVSSVKISAQRAEIYCRAIAHNILSYFLGLFKRTR